VTGAITTAGTFLGSGWYPEISGIPARFRLRILAPPGTWPVTAGRLVERGESPQGTLSIWTVDSPLPTLALAAGPYQVDQEQSGGIPVYTFFGAANSPLAPTYLATARDNLSFYQNLFGPYPFPKFAVVENFFPTGYGFPSWTLLGSSVVRLPFIVNTSLGHEIAHSWWGTGVRVAAGSGNWSEGLATYVADYLFQERTSPEAARDYRLKILREYATLVTTEADYPLVAFISRRGKRDQAIGYGKAAMVFHMARRRVGETAFWEGLKQVAAERMFAAASWQDFAAAFNRDGSFGMADFMNQWVARPGAPDQRLAAVTAKPTASGWDISGRLEQSPPFFAFETVLRLETSGPFVTDTLVVREGSTNFRMISALPPRRLLVDPEVDLFRRLVPEEIPPTVNSLRRPEPLLVVFAAGQRETLAPAARDLLTGLGREATLVGEDQVDPEGLARQDFLLVGWPRRPELRPALPDQLDVGQDGFTMKGRHFSEAGAALFTILNQPGNPQRFAALFLPLSAESGRVAARKIPHYGKYSYLAFVGGENVAKGTWPATYSPLVFDFLQEQRQTASP
jgi:hypothetical protein